MLEFLKTFLKGIIITLTSPLWLLFISLSIIVFICIYIFGEVMSFINFFRGINYSKEDRYSDALTLAKMDKEIPKNDSPRLELENEMQKENSQSPLVQPQVVIINQSDSSLLSPEQALFIAKKNAAIDAEIIYQSEDDKKKNEVVEND